ncbi:MAG: purine-nucleoside phosphorylase [Sphingomonadales bacterium]
MTNVPEMKEKILASVAAVKKRYNGVMPEVALVLGSGLNGIAEAMDIETAISNSDVPGFPQPSVQGHAGRMLIGRLDGAPVVCLQGRVHFYEGQGLDAMVVLVRTLKALGVKTLVLTNAAGSLNPEVGPGSLMALTDHINFAGVNPLIGPNDDEIGPRFPDMTGAYDSELRQTLFAAAADEGVHLNEGAYLMVSGPNFETPAEIGAFRVMGADAVGMSTVPECLVARHCGMRVAAVSTITNLAAGLSGDPLTHDETMEVGARASEQLTRVLVGFLNRVG